MYRIAFPDIVFSVLLAEADEFRLCGRNHALKIKLASLRDAKQAEVLRVKIKQLEQTKK